MADFFTIMTAIGVPVGGAALTLLGKWILAGQKDIKDDIASNHADLDAKILSNHTVIDRRVSSLEAENRTFMSKTDLEKVFEHDRNGRKTIQQSVDFYNQKNVEDIVKLRCDVAKLEQNDAYITKEVSALSQQMDKGLGKLEDKIDKVAGCVSEIAKKV